MRNAPFADQKLGVILMQGRSLRVSYQLSADTVIGLNVSTVLVKRNLIAPVGENERVKGQNHDN